MYKPFSRDKQNNNIDSFIPLGQCIDRCYSFQYKNNQRKVKSHSNARMNQNNSKSDRDLLALRSNSNVVNCDFRKNSAFSHKCSQEMLILPSKINDSAHQKIRSRKYSANFVEKSSQENQQQKYAKYDRNGLLSLRRSMQDVSIPSTISMLKRQVQILQSNDCIGTVKRLSTLQQLPTLATDNFVRPTSKSINLQIPKQNTKNRRKIAKGRPEVYNWVKTYKRSLAEIQSKHKNVKKEQKQNVIAKQEKKDKNSTFLQRLRKLQDLKQKASIQYQNLKRLQGDSQKDCNHKVLKTLS